MIARTGDLVDAAAAGGTAVVAFNVITVEHAEAIVMGLERAERPGVLQLSENAVRFHGEMAPVLAACVELAAASAMPVAVHLDHFQDAELTRDGLRLSARLDVSSVMVDAAHLPDAQNLATTAERARDAHAAGLWVEAELGEIGGKGGAHTPGVRTDPAQAKDFVAATRVDALAVAVGSEHAMTTADATLDLDLVDRLAVAVPVPLVLHGSSGVPLAMLAAAVAAGIRKVNVGTALNVAYTGAVRAWLAQDERGVDPRRFLRGARDAMADVVAELVDALA